MPRGVSQGVVPGPGLNPFSKRDDESRTKKSRKATTQQGENQSSSSSSSSSTFHNTDPTTTSSSLLAAREHDIKCLWDSLVVRCCLERVENNERKTNSSSQMPFPKRTVWVLLLAVVVGGTAAVKTAPWTTPARSIRGGALGPKKHSHGAAADETETTAATAATTAGSSVTVEEYAAAMRKKDARDRRGRDEGKKRDLPDDVDETEAPEGTKNDNDTNKDKDKDSTTPDATTGKDQEASTVGVKSHNAKKSNAVGDPDGVGSDDDSDEDDEASTDDWEDFEEEMEEIDILSNAAATTTTQEVQVELELLEQDLQVDEDDDSVSETTSPSGGGGVGLRLSQRLGRRKNRTKEWRSSSATAATNDRDTKTVTAAAAVTIGPAELLEAWSPYVYLPPTGAAMEYLMEHARHLDGASKSRLDRRTLYAGLLMEWRHARTYRKFLPAATSQALQAALSLATQPVWRRSFPRPSGIRLYEDHEAAARGCTLAMQETIAMALVSE